MMQCRLLLQMTKKDTQNETYGPYINKTQIIKHKNTTITNEQRQIITQG